MTPTKIEDASVDLFASHILLQTSAGYLEISQHLFNKYLNLPDSYLQLSEIGREIRNCYGELPRGTMVISESGLDGFIYEYGNHGKYWELVGKTCGYA